MRHTAPTLLCIALAAAGCLFDPVVAETIPVRCVDDDDCPGEMACAVGRCLGPEAIAGERCGDGLVARSGAEACDDGDANSDELPDACRSDCTAPRCGDGVQDRSEGCDDGNDSDSDACTSFCVPSTCGDRVVHVGVEACDDGNGDFGDDCLPNCRLNVCGDGFLRTVSDAATPELCDDGNVSDTDGCRSSCVPNVCGDGVVNVLAEQCDDGNADDGDACLSSCVAARCGDGVVQVGVEACDDGDADFGDACLPTCVENVCGDGFIDPAAEECDDGNRDDGDSCLGTCVSNVCGDGVRNEVAEECDDGNMEDGDACRVTCRLARCGDGVVHVGVEACDDGNGAADDACLPSCVENVCGDGVVQRTGPGAEDCDDGNVESLDGCSDRCSLILASAALGVRLVSGPTWAATTAAGDNGALPVLAVADDQGLVHLIEVLTGERVVLNVGPGVMAPAGERPDTGFAPRRDGSSLTWELTDLGTEPTEPPEAPDGGPAPTLVLEQDAFGRHLRVFDIGEPAALTASGDQVAVAGADRFVANSEGALLRVDHAAVEQLLAPAAGALSAPTAVLDGRRRPVGALLGRGQGLDYASLLREPVPDPVTGEPILDPLDGGFVGDDPDTGAPLDGGFSVRERPCLPDTLPLGGEVMGQAVVTDRGELYAVSSDGEVLQSRLQALSCPVGFSARRAIRPEGARPVGPPAVAVDRRTGVASVVYATSTGIVRALFPDRAEPSATTHELPTAPVGPVAVNEDGDVFVGSIDGRLFGQDPSGTIILDVGLPGRVVGAPLIIQPVVVVATETGDLVVVERGGRLPGVSAGDNGTWMRNPGGDLCGSSAGRIEEERDGACASGGSSSSLALLALALATAGRARRRSAIAESLRVGYAAAANVAPR